MQRSPRKKTSKISEAVFRGSRSFYSFEVFPLTAKDIADAPGVFIISRRRMDKFGSGHHNAVCIGETRSILAEIRHHKRAKCVKQTAANVICFLMEERPEERTRLVEDLVASRKFACVRNEIKSAIQPRPAIVEPKPERPRRRVVKVEPASEGANPIAEKTKAKTKKKTTAAKTKTPKKVAAKVGKKKAVTVSIKRKGKSKRPAAARPRSAVKNTKRAA